MELTIKVNYDDVVKLVNDLPAAKIKELKQRLDENQPVIKTIKDKSDFQKLLLSAPTWSKEEFQEFKSNRRSFNLWRHQG